MSGSSRGAVNICLHINITDVCESFPRNWFFTSTLAARLGTRGKAKGSASALIFLYLFEGIYEFMHFIDLPLTGFYWRSTEYFMMFLFGMCLCCRKLISKILTSRKGGNSIAQNTY